MTAIVVLVIRANTVLPNESNTLSLLEDGTGALGREIRLTI